MFVRGHPKSLKHQFAKTCRLTPRGLRKGAKNKLEVTLSNWKACF